MRRINAVLCMLALVLVLSVSIEGAWAYFTTYAQARVTETVSTDTSENISDQDTPETPFNPENPNTPETPNTPPTPDNPTPPTPDNPTPPTPDNPTPPINVDPEVEVDEDFSDWTKRITITNTGDVPVYVRVWATGPAEYQLYTYGEGWRESGTRRQFYYVAGNGVLEPGASTSVLYVQINDVPNDDIEDGTTFDVVVNYEALTVANGGEGPLADSAGWPK